MRPLRDHLTRVPELRIRSWASSLAPAFSGRTASVPPRLLEEQAAFLFAHVATAVGGPFREQLIADRSRYLRLVDHVHRCPSVSRPTEGGG
jgi:hypothetical protein